jgi:hypothetical protein
MSQHLAARSGKHIGALLNLGQLEYIIQNTDLQHVKIFFRPDNKWPARVFGGFAGDISDPSVSDLRTFGYVKLPVDQPLPAAPGVEVIEAVQDDLGIVERYFIAKERGLLVQSEDLTRHRLNLASLNGSYRKIGLQRHRRVLLAVSRHEPLGFALVEISSPGLNFSELLSSFQVFLLPDGELRPDEVRKALIAAAVPLYRQAQRPHAVLLVPEAEEPEYARLGVAAAKRYSAWTFQRAVYQRFGDHVNRLAKALGRRYAPKETTQVTQ